MTLRFPILYTLVAIALTGPALAAPSAHPVPTPAPTASPLYQTMALPTPALLGGQQVGASPEPLSLHDAKMIAIKGSPQLELARAALDLAGGQLEISKSAAFPDLSATGNAGRSKGTIRTGVTGGLNSAIFTSDTASASIRQLIFDAGSTYAKISSARYSRDAARLSALREVDAVLFNVAQQFYLALQARYQYQAAIESRKAAEVQEQLVEAQFKAGVASQAEVLTAQLPVAQARLAEAQAANGEQSQIAALLNAMGLPSDTPVNLVTQPETQTPILPQYATVLATAAAQRTDLQAAQASYTSASRGVRAARASRFPAVTGTASAGTASTGVNSAGTFATNGGNYTSTYSFGIGVTLPLFDSGLINGQIASAEAQKRTAAANLRNAQLAVSLTVRQAYLGVQTALAQVAAAKVERDQAQTVLDVTNAQYKAGVTTLPLLLNAQAGLTKALSDYVNALFGAYTAEQNLYFAEGTIASR